MIQALVPNVSTEEDHEGDIATGDEKTTTTSVGGAEQNIAGRGVERLKDPEVTEYQAQQPEHVHQPLVEAVLKDLRLWQSALPRPAGAAKEEEKAKTFVAAGNDGCHSTGRAAARTALVMDRALEQFYGGPGSRDEAFWETPEAWAT